MWLRDNESKVLKKDFQKEGAYLNIAEHLLDKTIKYLSEKENLFVFPYDLEEIEEKDIDNSGKVLETLNDKIKTGNIIGFIGYGQEQLSIHSRFAVENQPDYFLHYMLQKVLHINLTNLDISMSTEEQFYDLLIYVFPKYLQAALRKGVYKEYQRFRYHDSHVKGSIDVARHIKMSTPFLGKIAYTTREFSFDNSLTQLIRHTIEYIKSSQKNAQHILFADSDRRQCVTAVIEATPSYRQSDRQKVLLRNHEKPVRHAYYHEYAILQRLCLMILGRNKQNVGGQQDKVHGILFDVAWLWEEYLATLLPDLTHAKNKTKEKGISVFSDRTRTVYPDFYSKEFSIVLDAKYKKLDENGIRREDLYQIISYSHILEATTAGFIFPRTVPSDSMIEDIGELLGKYPCILKKWGLLIPQEECRSFKEFCRGMKKEEEDFAGKLAKLLESDST